MKKIVEELLTYFRPDNQPFTEDGYYKVLEQSTGDHTWQKAVYEKLNQLNNIITFHVYRVHYNDDFPDNSMDLGDVYHPTMPPNEIPAFVEKVWQDHQSADQGIDEFVDLLVTKFGFIEEDNAVEEDVETIEIE